MLGLAQRKVGSTTRCKILFMGRVIAEANRARYTQEFRLEALRLVGTYQSIAANAAILDLPDQTLHNYSLHWRRLILSIYLR